MALLSVIIPVYNEVSTIKQILDKINSLNIDKEVIVVDAARNPEVINEEVRAVIEEFLKEY